MPNYGCDCWLLGLSCSCCLGVSPTTTSCCCTGVAAAAVLLSRAWHHLKRFSWRFLFCCLLFLLLSLCAPAAAVAAAIGRKSKVTCSPSGSCSKVTLAQKPALTNIIRWVLAEHYRHYRLYWTFSFTHYSTVYTVYRCSTSCWFYFYCSIWVISIALSLPLLEFYEAGRLYQIIPGLYQIIPDYTRIIPDFTRFYLIIANFTRLYQILPEYTKFYKNTHDFTRLYQV